MRTSMPAPLAAAATPAAVTGQVTSINTGGVKKCGHCKATKAQTTFSADATRRDGLRNWCKACESASRARRYQERVEPATRSARATAKRRYAGEWDGDDAFKKHHSKSPGFRVSA